MHVRIKGFQIFKDRYGKRRCYHRATKTAIDLEKYEIGSAEFISECSRITALANHSGAPKAGTLGMLITKYREHSQFLSLAPRTRSDYQKMMDYLQPIAETPLSRFNPPLIVKIRDKAFDKHGRRKANYVKAVLSILFSWGVERGHMSSNPALKVKNIKALKNATKANRPWKDYEREAVLAALPPHMLLPINLMMFCALDPTDALSLARTAIKDGFIDTKRAKTGEAVWIPVPQPVLEALKAAPKHDAITVCANSRGLPWTTSGYSSSWIKIRDRLLEAGAVEKGLTLKGLRHTVATILAEMGFDDRTIADMLGQRTITMAQHYSKTANRSKKMTGVVTDFDAEMNKRRTEFVKLS